jgi:hypothetical protein
LTLRSLAFTNIGSGETRNFQRWRIRLIGTLEADMRRVVFFCTVVFLMLSTMANANVLYEFVSDGTISNPPFTSLQGSFSYIAPNFITSFESVPLDRLRSCSASDSGLGSVPCGPPQFSYDYAPPETTIGFGVLSPVTTYYLFYFAPSAFTSYGTFDSNPVVGNDGVLRVSFTTLAVVPEPATWAMLIAGFAGLGAIGFHRRRRALVRA